MTIQIRRELARHTDPKYRDFALSLLPGLTIPLLGVRLPKLRELARRCAKEYGKDSLALLTDDTFEERMLQGLIIGALKAPPEEIFNLIKNFVPKINNWSVCDSFCASLHLAKRHPQVMWDFLTPYFQDSREYFFRFAAVNGLFHFTQEPFASQLFHRLEEIPSSGFYAKMAAAWAISVLCVHQPEKTLQFLKNCRWDESSRRQAILKITQSRRIAPEIKSAARSYK